MRLIYCLTSLMTCLILLNGCASTRQTQSTVKQEVKPDEKIGVEAYLFDAKLNKDGTRTSVRLYFFQTDSVIAISGRGYLGKGALKGWLTDDSLYVYFPSTNEYLYEAVNDLFGSFDCSDELPLFHLMALFSQLPDEVIEDVNASVVINNDNEKRPKYEIQFLHCPWKIEITYDLQDKGFRIRNFTFDDGNETSLQSNRREYKESREVKTARFESMSSSDMTRIIP